MEEGIDPSVYPLLPFLRECSLVQQRAAAALERKNEVAERALNLTDPFLPILRLRQVSSQLY